MELIPGVLAILIQKASYESVGVGSQPVYKGPFPDLSNTLRRYSGFAKAMLTRRRELPRPTSNSHGLGTTASIGCESNG
jgi:hypothetical protein